MFFKSSPDRKCICTFTAKRDFMLKTIFCSAIFLSFKFVFSFKIILLCKLFFSLQYLFSCPLYLTRFNFIFRNPKERFNHNKSLCSIPVRMPEKNYLHISLIFNFSLSHRVFQHKGSQAVVVIKKLRLKFRFLVKIVESWKYK